MLERSVFHGVAIGVAKVLGRVLINLLDDGRIMLHLYQRHDFLTLVGFPNQLNSDSRLAKEICHASCCSGTPGF